MSCSFSNELVTGCSNTILAAFLVLEEDPTCRKLGTIGNPIYFWQLVECGGHHMHILNWPRNTLEGIRASGWRGPHEGKGAQGAIKRDQLSFWRYSNYLTNKLVFVRSVVQRVYRLFSHESLTREI